METPAEYFNRTKDKQQRALRRLGHQVPEPAQDPQAEADTPGPWSPYTSEPLPSTDERKEFLAVVEASPASPRPVRRSSDMADAPGSPDA